MVDLGVCPARSPAIRCEPSTLSENFFHLGCGPREDGAFVGDHERAFDQNRVLDHRVEDFGFGSIGESEFLVLRFALANRLAGLEAGVGEEFFELGSGRRSIEVLHNCGFDARVLDEPENSSRGVAPLIVEDGCRCHVRHSASASGLVGQTGEQRTPPARCT